MLFTKDLIELLKVNLAKIREIRENFCTYKYRLSKRFIANVFNPLSAIVQLTVSRA